MKKPITRETILNHMTELDCCALLINGEMILGTSSGGGNEFLYASVNDPDYVYWNSSITDEEAVKVYSGAVTIEPIE